MKGDYKQMQINFRKDYLSDNKESDIYAFDTELIDRLKSKGLKQSTINKVCAYYSQTCTFMSGLACHAIGSVSYATTLHISEREDQVCRKHLEDVGYIRFMFDKVLDPNTESIKTIRKCCYCKQPKFDNPQIYWWLPGIRKFDLSIDECVVMAMLMLNYTCIHRLSDITHLNRATITKCVKHLQSLNLLDGLQVNYEVCGYDVDDTFHTN